MAKANADTDEERRRIVEALYALWINHPVFNLYGLLGSLRHIQDSTQDFELFPEARAEVKPLEEVIPPKPAEETYTYEEVKAAIRDAFKAAADGTLNPNDVKRVKDPTPKGETGEVEAAETAPVKERK